MLAALVWLVRREGRRAAVHLVWLGPLALLLPSLYPLPEERVHFALFGAMGFLTLQALPRGSGIVLALSIAGLDEMLQWFLPDRIADWRDVGVNALSALVGCLLALRARGRP
ncbi:MAG: hypothetical protein QOD06_539 [Candidatus Binatota bacterium]|nr:hypothetical protein [Candidatus Binatota bacterium]